MKVREDFLEANFNITQLASKIVVMSDNSFDISRGNNSNVKAKTLYQCPMKCEGEKSYSSPGKCPCSKMDLILVGGGHIFY